VVTGGDDSFQNRRRIADEEHAKHLGILPAGEGLTLRPQQRRGIYLTIQRTIQARRTPSLKEHVQ
jgi:hypothetical protein